MLQRKWLAVPILSVALVAVWGGAEVQAEPQFTKLVAPLTCNATSPLSYFNGKYVKVTAVPINGEFPATVQCPAPDNAKQCSQYNYDFEWTGISADDAYVSVSTNVDLYSATATPGAITGVIENPANKGDNEVPFLGFGIWEQRTVRFDGHVSPLHATIITSPSIPIPGTVAGTNPLHAFFGTCMLQVPGQSAPGAQDTCESGVKQFQRPDGKGVVCARTNCVTGCEVPVFCESGLPIPTLPISNFITLPGGPAKTSSTPGSACSTFSLDDGTAGSYVRCSGGVCVKYTP